MPRVDSISMTTLYWMSWGVGLAFIFAFGARAGSFLNVVMYRLPEG